jgi:hypothetical protein
MYYKNPTNLDASINRFYNETKKAGRGRGKSSGQLAQSVQKSGYPDRYDQHRKEAGQLLRKFSGGGATFRGKGGAQTATVPGVDNSVARNQTILNYLQNRDKPGSLLELAQGMKDTESTPDRKVSTGRKKSASGVDTSGSRAGTTNIDGYPVNNSIAADLKYARAHGWKGKVTSGYRSNAKQAQIYASGVRPAAKPGQSMHRFKRPGKGAIDGQTALNRRFAWVIGALFTLSLAVLSAAIVIALAVR